VLMSSLLTNCEATIATQPGLCNFTVGLLADRVCDVSVKEPLYRGLDVPKYEWVFLMLLGLALLSFAIAFAMHAFNRHNAMFQGIYLRFFFAMILLAVLIVIGVFFPYSEPIIEVCVTLLEGFLALLFGGFLVAWASQRGSVTDTLIKHPKSKTPYRLLCYQFGSDFSSGTAALDHWHRMVRQFLVIKTFTSLGTMSIQYVTDTLSVNTAFQLLFAVINLISILLMLRALAVLYVSLKKADLLKDSRSGRKFVIIKLVFSCLVINNLFISGFLKRGTFAPPTWVCENHDGTIAEDTLCNSRFLYLIFLGELVVLLYLALYTFSHVDFLKFDPQEIQTASSFSPGFTICGLLKATFCENRFTTLWKLGKDEIMSQKSEAFRSKASTYRRYLHAVGLFSLLLLIVGLYVPVWYTSEVGGCKISTSLVSAVWCHGSCPSIPANQTEALQTYDGTRDLIVSSVCVYGSTSTATFGAVSVFFAYIALVFAVLASVFKSPRQLLLSAILALVPFVLMNVYYTDYFNSQQVIITLKTSYGLTGPKQGVSYYFMIFAVAFLVLTAVIAYRFQHYMGLAVKVQAAEKRSDLEMHESDLDEPAVVVDAVAIELSDAIEDKRAKAVSVNV